MIMTNEPHEEVGSTTMYYRPPLKLGGDNIVETVTYWIGYSFGFAIFLAIFAVFVIAVMGSVDGIIEDGKLVTKIVWIIAIVSTKGILWPVLFLYGKHKKHLR